MRECLSSELLGFAPADRVLIVNADDLGLCPAVNRGIVAALDHGVARSTSLLTTCPGTSEAIRILHARPEIPFGVHLTLVRDRPTDGWAPRAPANEVPTLRDPRGLFPLRSAARELMRRIRPDDAEREFRAQLRMVLDAGLHPTHLDFHGLADGGRPDLFDAAAILAADHGLALRVWLPPGRSRARRAGLPVVDHPFLDSFSLDCVGKQDRCEQLLRDLEPGLTEWAVHPAADDAGARTRDPHEWDVRTTDLEFLTSARAARTLRDEGVTVIDYRPLQRVWRTIGGMRGT